MKLSNWFTLIGLLVGIGCLKVAERNAVYFKGYALGGHARSIHETQTQVGWLSAEVEGLASPGRLAHEAQERRLKLVARSTLGSPARQPDRRALLATPLPGTLGGPLPLVHVAVAPEPDGTGAAE